MTEKLTVVEMHPPRWAPDEMLPESAIQGRVNLVALPDPDRAWVVASLDALGYSNDVMAEKLHCSRRLVQQVRAQPITIMCAQVLALQRDLERAQARRTPTTAGAVTDLVHEIDRLKASRGKLIDQLADMRKRCHQPQIVIMKPPTRRRRAIPPEFLPIPLF